MVTRFEGTEPWAAITEACKTAGPRFAAVAYIGIDGPSLLPLKSRDTLVVNSGRAALLSHATSPEALQTYLDRGVTLYEHPLLHAKVLATKTQAVIGSANASTHSTTLAEAVILTDSSSRVDEVREFVKGLASQSTPITQHRIDWARGVWQQGRGGGPPGTDGAIKQPFPANPTGRLYLMQEFLAASSAAVENAVAGTRHRARRRAGLAQDFDVDWLTDTANADLFRAGDLVVIVADGLLSLWEIDGDPIEAGRDQAR